MSGVRGGKTFAELRRNETRARTQRARESGTMKRDGARKMKRPPGLMHNLSQLKQEDVSQRQVIVVKMVIARRNFIRRIYFRG